MTQFYLIRHGEPEWNINEQYKLKGHGRDLVPLTEAGVNQVYWTAKDERLKEAEVIVSSPYTRALQTAAILSKELGLDIKVELDLREWQPDLTFEYDSLERLAELGNDYDTNHGVYPPGVTKLWESKELLKNRIEKVIDRYLGYKKVIITGHGMAFRTLVGEVEEIPHASITGYNKTQAVIETTQL
ncbi:fructose-2,6-bisphosphatase [Paenibacillus sp. FSL P4-0081]|uniref:histidine phosphatase family protein n=1 Tax=Paenibacillus sp. FSL P4-0081 TaxID=1536769 RepID=UPI0004F7C52E|nr:histidine phosphatase family protein [Paenibacillus sp. FSL P4-0081]AIQ28080.1 fructose-2,6-bisphosphatase [Paenibacillus sp. FSL P4-0081]